MLESNPINTFEWIWQHAQILTPTAVIYATWRIARFATVIETRVLTAEQHVTKMATNCFPTMQTSLQKQDELLQSMDGHLKTLAAGEISRTPKPRRKR